MQGQVWGAGRSFLGGDVCTHFAGEGGSRVPGTKQEPGLAARLATWCQRRRHCSGRRQDDEERPEGQEVPGHHQDGVPLPARHSSFSRGRAHIRRGSPRGPSAARARPQGPPLPTPCSRRPAEVWGRGSADSTGSIPLWEPRPLAPLQRAGNAGHIPAGGYTSPCRAV